MGFKWSLVRIQSPRPLFKMILITGDDSIYSEGLRSLREKLQEKYEILVVATDRDRSTSGHSITLHRPLRLRQLEKNVHIVDGTPTDCVVLALNELLKSLPEMVVSGINNGKNLGDDITYSGTVAAAFEATLMGIPSLAISLVVENDEKAFFDTAAYFANKLVELTLKNGLPQDTILNVNVPNLPLSDVKGIRITRQGKRVYGDHIMKRKDPRGRPYFWVGGDIMKIDKSPGTDFRAIEDGFISVTPVRLDLTKYDVFSSLKYLEKINFGA